MFFISYEDQFIIYSNVLTEIRDNFEDWLDDGGWNFLIEDVSTLFAQ